MSHYERGAKTPDEVALDYMPLARKVARNYAGRGAEFDDLAQEGFLALRELVVRHDAEGRGQALGLYIARRLRAKVRDAASRLRRASLHDSLELRAEEDGFDVPYVDGAFAEFDLLEGLSPAERRLALDLAGGLSQRECAARLLVTQQCVSKRVACLRRKLRRGMTR